MNEENSILIRIDSRRIHEFMKTRIFFFMLFCVSFLLLFQRNTHVLISANFWSEDGTIFYAQMHNEGLISFFYPYAGYMHLIPRLTALIAMPFGVINGPYAVNCIALLLHTLPILFLFSERFNFIGSAYKFFLAAYYILMPNAGETLGNIANIQWHMALMLLMVLTADPPKNFTHKLYDILILIFSGLSGPFIIFLMPFILLTREGVRFKLLASCIALIQIITVLLTAPEIHNPQSFDSELIPKIIFWCIRLIDTRILWGTFLPFPVVPNAILNFIPALAVLILLAFAVPLVYFFVKCSKRFRICTIFAACILFSSMFRCLNQNEFPEWFTKGGGERYLLIPCMMYFTFLMFVIKRFIQNKSKNFRMRVYACISIALRVH